MLTPKRREKSKRKSRSTHDRSSMASPKNKNTSLYQAMMDPLQSSFDGNNNNNMQQRTVTPTAETMSSPSSRSYRKRLEKYDKSIAHSSSSSSSPSPVTTISTRRRGKSTQQQQPRQDSDCQQRSSFATSPSLLQVVSTDDYDEDLNVNVNVNVSADLNSNANANANLNGNNEQEEYYAFDEEMPMDELMGLNHHQQQQQQQQHKDHHHHHRNYGSPRSAISSPSISKDHSQNEHSAAAYGSMAPTKEMSDVLGLSSIMAMASPLNWDKTNKSKESSNQNHNSNPGNQSSSNSKSIGGSGIEQMIAALNSGSTACRPPNLNKEDRILWDAIQSTMINDRNEHLSKRRSLEIDLQKSVNLLDQISAREIELEREVSQVKGDRADMEHKYTAMSIVVEQLKARKKSRKNYISSDNDADDDNSNSNRSNISNRSDNVQQLKQMEIESLRNELEKKESLLKKQQDNHDNEVRAIQRVLADITTEKMDLQEALELAEANAITVAVETAVEKRIEDGTDDKEEGSVKENDDRDIAIASVSNEEEINKLKETLNVVEKEYQSVKLDAEKKTGRVLVLENDLKAARVKMNDTIAEKNKLIAQTESVNSEIDNFEYKLEHFKCIIGENETKIGELEEEIFHQRKEYEMLHGEKKNTETAHCSTLDEVKQLKNDNEQKIQELDRLKKERELVIDEVESCKRERAHAVNEVENLKKTRENDVHEVERLKKARDHAVNEIEKFKRAREHAVNEVEKAIMEAKAVKAEHTTTTIDDASDTSDKGNNDASKTSDEENDDASDTSDKENDDTSDKENDDSQTREDEPDADDVGVVEAEEKLLSVNAEEVQNLKKTLSVTNSSLENAKKIIASLENANGSLALDSRSKLKDKEEEFSMMQKESEHRKRLLDSLATELRDLQRKQGDIEDADSRTRAQVMKQRALMGHLETSLSDLQVAVVVHEASLTMTDSSINSNSNIEEISEILGDTLYAISATLESTERYVDEFGDEHSVVASDIDISSEVGRHIDSIIRNDREAASQGLRHELDQKKVAVKRLEEALKKQNEEMKKLRSQFEARGRGNYDNNHQLRADIEGLRQQCSTNMEVLAKKERELSVLRSSLKVDENETGYISDDASDDDDDETEVGSTISAANLNAYGPAEAEAYATILAQASGNIEIPGRAQQEVQSLKRDLMEALGEKESASKELQVRRESLANAKMIISSLEKANKGMMEDLHSRLQDSNVAMQSMLYKSTEHEKAAETLGEIVQKLEQEKLEERQKYEAEMRKLKRDLPLSTKESRTREMRSDKDVTPSEEKKEDIRTFECSI